MKKIAVIAAFAFASMPFAFGQNPPPAQPGSQSGANAPANAPSDTHPTGKARHHKKARHKKAKKEASGTANRMAGGK